MSARKREKIPSTVPTRAWRVLLVEDDELNAVYATAVLRRFGCLITRASDVDESIQLAAARAFDIIFMDRLLPSGDGVQVASQIRVAERQAGRRPVWIVALTACAFDHEKQECIAAGMNDVLCKPFAIKDMQAAVERYEAAVHTPEHWQQSGR